MAFPTEFLPVASSELSGTNSQKKKTFNSSTR